MKAPLNYTTTIDASKTATECLTILSRHRALRVSVDNNEDGKPSGLSFVMGTRFGPRQFARPVPVRGTLAKLKEAYAAGGSGVQRRHLTEDHARNVAWRVVKGWLESQLELADAGLAELAEIMLPWMKVDEERTMWQAYQESELRMLEPSDG